MAFKKGISGNLKGRPAGRTFAAKMRKTIEKQSKDILQSVIDAATHGDMGAAKLLLDRVCPPLKPAAALVQFNADDANNDMTAIAKGIISAIANGQLEPDIGAQVISGLANVCKIIETQELTTRLEALEAKNDH